MGDKRTLRVGIIRFPGSNCDYDTRNYFKKYGHRAFFIWYTDTKLPPLDLLVLPGGFAFGDRVYKKATARYTIDPGALALRAPIMGALRRAAGQGVPILGICNGFQILVKSGLLPGKLVRNNSKKFFCDYVSCGFDAPFFGDKSLKGKHFSIPVAHGYGNYRASKSMLENLKKNGQIFLRYKTHNPNGSIENIAGVSNKAKTIFGMMPHPERSPSATRFMRTLETYAKR